MRKTPRQARARATVDVILDAGAQVLARTGRANFTTNAVAEAAGVSIGSLYQYFPNKLALVDAITHRHLETVLLLLGRIGDGDLPLDRRIEQLISGMIAIHAVDPGLHRVLMEEVPISETMRAVHRQFETQHLERYRLLVRSARSGMPEDVEAVAAQVLSSAVAGVIHDAARRGNLRGEAVREELARLVGACLQAGPPILDPPGGLA